MTILYRGFALLCFLAFGVVHAQEENLKGDAARRLVQAHDPAIFVSTGALYLKQEAIRSAGGKPLSATQLAEVGRIIDAQVRDSAWFHAVLGAAIAQYMTEEEADEIAVHFTTEVSQLQRHVIELSVGEVLMSTYTFTNKTDYRLAASPRELQDVQRAVGSMINHFEAVARQIRELVAHPAVRARSQN
ncbi:MAG: hypothetical protein EXR36_03730 [Betaproteobacteria bacterium]|nr:hypothetical protein [Betaproteobacteria bacterium]